MLTCPFCDFENINSQRSCERCGKPLQRWRVIDIPQPGQGAIAASDLYNHHYLDPDHRYRILSRSATPVLISPRALVVLDCQPTAGSPLQALQSAWLENPALEPADSPLAAPVPPVAYPYLALQADYFPTVPEVHHAWQTPQRTLLLIEDRTTWLPLASGWGALDDPLQHIQWLFETTLLWQALAPWQSQATVLNLQRLTLNENSLLCLTQIDQVPNRSPLPLQNLGQLWQKCLATSALVLPPSVQALAEALLGGEVTQIEQLQNVLAEAAQTLQSVADPVTVSPWDHGPEDDPSDWLDTVAEPMMASALAEAYGVQPSRDEAAGGDTSAIADGSLDTMAVEAQESDDDGSGAIETPTMLLPMKLAHLDDFGQSHVGQQRHHNEDYFFTQTQLHKISGPQGTVLRSKGLYILCDGMGGHASGEVASQLAVRTLRDYISQHWDDCLPDHDTLIQAVMTANQAIFDINQSKASSGVGRMGTTLVLVLVHNLDIAVVHVGDSRLYSYSKRLGLRQLTLDHEVGQREINRGVEPAIAYARPDAYQLTQALGPRSCDELLPSVAYHEITEDTLLVLCSDGLSDNNLLEHHVDTHIAKLMGSRARLEAGTAQLIDLANEKNGHDNITAILVRIKLQPDMAGVEN
jgi:protein phosphatase